MRRFPTLSADNQFHFVCPIFGTEERLYDCMQRDDANKRGKPDPDRGGCKAMMTCCKCPIDHLVKSIVRGDDIDLFSAEHKVGRLPEKILDRIGPIVIQEQVVNRTPMSPEEQKAINAVMTGAKLVRAETKSEPAKRKARKDETPKPAATEKVSDADVTAAMTGDMSAAITKAAATPAPESKPEIKPEPAKPAPAPTASEEGRPLSLLERARLAREGRAA